MTPRQREEMRRRKGINDRRRQRERVKRAKVGARTLARWKRERQRMTPDEFRAAVNTLWPGATDAQVGALIFRGDDMVYRYRTGRNRVPENIAKRLRTLVRDRGQ